MVSFIWCKRNIKLNITFVLRLGLNLTFYFSYRFCCCLLTLGVMNDNVVALVSLCFVILSCFFFFSCLVLLQSLFSLFQLLLLLLLCFSSFNCCHSYGYCFGGTGRISSVAQEKRNICIRTSVTPRNLVSDTMNTVS